MFYAYVLESLSKPGELYRGHSEDLKQRLAEHNAGKCPHTSKHVPWKLRFYAAFESLKLARNFDIQFIDPIAGSSRDLHPMRLPTESVERGFCCAKKFRKASTRGQKGN